jgi:hypothetical protein
MPATNDVVNWVADLYGESREQARTRLQGSVAEAGQETPGDRLSMIEAKVDALIARLDSLERSDRDRETREFSRVLGLPARLL